LLHFRCYITRLQFDRLDSQVNTQQDPLDIKKAQVGALNSFINPLDSCLHINRIS
jgi:hypothetical protein